MRLSKVYLLEDCMLLGGEGTAGAFSQDTYTSLPSVWTLKGLDWADLNLALLS